MAEEHWWQKSGLSNSELLLCCSHCGQSLGKHSEDSHRHCRTGDPTYCSFTFDPIDALSDESMTKDIEEYLKDHPLAPAGIEMGHIPVSYPAFAAFKERCEAVGKNLPKGSADESALLFKKAQFNRTGKACSELWGDVGGGPVYWFMYPTDIGALCLPEPMRSIEMEVARKLQVKDAEANKRSHAIFASTILKDEKNLKE